jgi:hypothetical protein
MQLYVIRSKINSIEGRIPPAAPPQGSRRLDDLGPYRRGPLHQKTLITLPFGGHRRAGGAAPEGADLRVDHGGRPGGTGNTGRNGPGSEHGSQATASH